jgi:putative long chain acyl-CoA synthase
VRKGERVGVLMGARPSALVTVAALNRLGAVAVLLRPGPDLAREFELGQVTSVVADPDHAAAARERGAPVWVLGGGTSRTVPAGTVDMEQIDPASVTPPSWYRPNPGRARDLAFILFSGHGQRIRIDHISNGRWALSALAAASAAELTATDTVYSVSPLHHPSGLLLATAGAAAGGARLAMADRFDPDTFWTEVRRYGATVVPYTWTMLHDLLCEPPRPEEAHHPIRLFVGSGMPANLWARVSERFAPAAVLELYASTRTDAILGNVSGRKIGSVGKPLPGTAPVRVVGYDPSTGRLRTGADGYAIPAAPDEIGMLLVATTPGVGEHDATVARGVFRADDAWTITGDLFRYDADGDLWYVDSVAALIDTRHGKVSPHSVEAALGRIAAVDLAACYPVTSDGITRAVAAVTLRPGRILDAAAITRALKTLDPARRPDTVVVDAIPVNSWHRPDVAALQAAGVPEPTQELPVWTRRNRAGGYRVCSVSTSGTPAAAAR